MATRDPSQRSSATRTHRLLLALGWWTGLVVVYLLLVDTNETAEIVAALILAALSTVALAAAAMHDMARGAPRLRWFALLARRLPARALKDCGIVFAALWRQVARREEVTGAFRVIRFEPGGDDARSAARRALVVAGVSLPPNSFVVAIDAERGRLLIHHLVPPARSPGGPGVEWPL